MLSLLWLIFFSFINETYKLRCTLTMVLTGRHNSMLTFCRMYNIKFV